MEAASERGRGPVGDVCSGVDDGRRTMLVPGNARIVVVAGEEPERASRDAKQETGGNGHGDPGRYPSRRDGLRAAGGHSNRRWCERRDPGHDPRQQICWRRNSRQGAEPITIGFQLLVEPPCLDGCAERPHEMRHLAFAQFAVHGGGYQE